MGVATIGNAVTSRSSTVPRSAAASTAPPRLERRRLRALAVAAGGPLLIVAGVLAVLHGFVFGGGMASQHLDPLTQALPWHCFQGSVLSAGQVPAWNPYAMGGAPFAADPQSGWLYLAPTVLYSALPCDVAFRVFVPLQPILAGLGAYWFLRGEEISRAGATVGGVMLSMGMAAAQLTLSFPFAGSVAWTAVALAAVGRYLRASTLSRRLLWLLAASLAWGQIAAAHLSHGLVLGSGLLLAYVVARSWADVNGRERTVREVALMAAALLAALPLVNLALLLPHLAYLPRSSLGLSYRELGSLAAEIAGRPPPPFHVGPSAGLTWPLKLATSPGAYLGAAGLALSLGWWRSRGPTRRVAVGLAVFGLVCYLLSLRSVASVLAPAISELPGGDFYRHSPWRFRLGLFLVLPLLAGIAVDRWRASETLRERLLLLAPGVALWWLLPALLESPGRLLLPLCGAAVGGALLAAGAARRAVAPLLAVVLLVEIGAVGLVGQRSDDAEAAVLTLGTLAPLAGPDFALAEFFAPSPMVRALRDRPPGRLLSFDPQGRGPRGYLESQDVEDWPLLANQRAMLFGLEDAQGYNPVQPLRYWTFVRAVSPARMKYNAAVFPRPGPLVRDLLQVTSIIAPTDVRPDGTEAAVASEGEWALYPVSDPAPRASVVTGWRVVQDADQALEAVTAPGFDPAAEVVLERDPGLGAPSEKGGGSATYTPLGHQGALVEVDTSAPAVVLVRNVHDPAWRATVDGRPVAVLVADHFLQGVPVPAGRHTIVLAYDDPSIGYGLLGSAVVILGLLGAALLLGAQERVRARRAGTGPASAPQSSSQNGVSGGGGDPPSNVRTR